MSNSTKPIETFTSQERSEVIALGQMALKIARPLVWRTEEDSKDSKWRGATCFVLRFEHGLVGVTAGHVIEIVEAEIEKSETLSCYLRTAPLDLIGSLICHDKALDLATFRITEQQLVDSETMVLDCRDAWPPPVPMKDSRILCAGFPEALREPPQGGITKFEALAYFSFAQDVTERFIIATYEVDRDYRLIAHPSMPELRSNWSGCSGGPVLMPGEHNGRRRFFPSGVIIDGPGEGDRSTLEFDMYKFHRINSINPDGSIG
jgi:hypothetical protein